MPVPVSRRAPLYPYEFRMIKVTGSVLVDFIVDPEGRTVEVRSITSTLPGFEPAAIAAVSAWRFKPGTKAGRPVYVHMQVPIVFELNEVP